MAIIKTDCDLDLYYAWFLKKRYGIVLNRPLRGSHISFISDIVDNDLFKQASNFFNGKEVEFSYNPDVRSNFVHWWLNVVSEDAENIRATIGLDKKPYFGFHLSIGYATHLNLEHSKYIVDGINKGLII